MLNVAFRCLDIDRLSPFRALTISCEDDRKPRRVITHDLLLAVNQKLLTRFKPYKFIGLIQLNTGLRLSEPVCACVMDCVLTTRYRIFGYEEMSCPIERTRAAFGWYCWWGYRF